MLLRKCTLVVCFTIHSSIGLGLQIHDSNQFFMSTPRLQDYIHTTMCVCVLCALVCAFVFVCVYMSFKPTNLLGVFMCAEFQITCIWQKKNLGRRFFEDRAKKNEVYSIKVISGTVQNDPVIVNLFYHIFAYFTSTLSLAFICFYLYWILTKR